MTAAVRPHLRDPYANRTRFHPHMLAVAGTTAWATDGGLPLVVRFDWETGAIQAVHEAPKQDRDGLSMHEGWHGRADAALARLQAAGRGPAGRFDADQLLADPAAVARTPVPLQKFAGVARGLVWRVHDMWCTSPGELRLARGYAPATGTLVAELDIPAPGITWPLVTEDAILGVVPGPWTVAVIPLDGRAAWTVGFDAVDVMPFLPPPPPPLDAEATEREILEDLRRSMLGTTPGRRPCRHIEVDDVRLEGRFPGSRIVVTFTADEHPGIRFARAQPIWQPDGELGGTDYMDVGLQEDTKACRYGLPSHPVVGDDGFCWF